MSILNPMGSQASGPASRLTSAEVAAVQGMVAGDGNVPQAIRVAAGGDSIIADACSAGTAVFTVWGWVSWFRRFAGPRINLPASRMFAVGGTTLDGFIANQLPQFVAAAGTYDVAIVGIGVNSLGSMTTAEMIARYTTIISTLRGLGVRVIMMCIRARRASGAITGDNLLQQARVNQWLKERALLDNGLKVFDPNPLYIDFATGNAQSAFMRDDVHDSQAGAYMMGRAFADWFTVGMNPVDSAFALLGDVYEATKNPTGNLLLNGLVGGSGGSALNGATGTVPASWRGSRSTGGATHTVAFAVTTDATYTTLPRTTLTWGGTADANLSRLDQYLTTTGVLVPGDRVVARMEVDFNLAANVPAFLLKASAQNGSFAELAVAQDGAYTLANGVLPAVTGVVWLETPPLVIPSGTVNLQVALDAYPQQSGTPSGVIGVKRVSLRKVV